MSNDRIKLAFYNLLAEDIQFNLVKAAQELKIPVPTLRRWKNDYVKSTGIADLDATINTDTIIIEEVAEKVFSQVVEATPMVVSRGELLTPEEQAITADTYKKKGIKEFTKKVSNLQMLQTEVQTVAVDLVTLIAQEVDKLRHGEASSFYSTKDIALLTNALTSIQNSFFNRPTTLINNVSGDVEVSGLSVFRESLKP